ncbi:MAG TPA: NADH-quinone oxidoreductase subunit M [Myxococcaceae bacterium]|nr:NADH-quinone oxidoreductase subunit M [Myxococcaceae bacterium]
MTSHLLSLVVAAPAAAAALLLLVPTSARTTTRWVALAGAATSLAGALAVAWLWDKGRGGFQFVEDLPLVPSLGIHLKLAADGWSVTLLLLTGLIIVTGVLASWTVARRDKEFFILLLVLVSGVFGVFVSQDLFVFFLFYEIAVLPMYLLIGIWGSSHEIPPAGPFRFVWGRFAVGSREYAAMKLTLMLLIGSAAILVAMFVLWSRSGARTFDLGALERVRFSRSTQNLVFPLIWLGFGTLAGVFPFHTWSPDGHASAPTAVSMLHAGVLMKLGAFGVMRVGMVLAPDAAAVWAPVVGTVAVINVLYGALCASAQTDLKYVIAYSSVSHMGVVMLGAATLNPIGWNGAVYQMFAHGIMTGLFFALVGLVYERAHTRAIARMGGFAHSMPAVAAFFTLASLSSLGLPGTAGFVGEFLVFLGAAKGAVPWWTVPGVLGAFVTAVYVLRAAKVIFWGPAPSGEYAHLSDARRTEWGAPLVLGAALVLFGFWPRLLLDFIDVTSVSFLGRLPLLAEALTR